MRPPGGGRRPTTGGRSEVSAGKAQRRVFEERRPHRSDRAETGRRRDPRRRREVRGPRRTVRRQREPAPRREASRRAVRGAGGSRQRDRSPPRRRHSRGRRGDRCGPLRAIASRRRIPWTGTEPLWVEHRAAVGTHTLPLASLPSRSRAVAARQGAGGDGPAQADA